MEKLGYLGFLAVFLVILIVFLKKNFNRKTDEIKTIQQAGLEPGIYFLGSKKGIEDTKGIIRIPDFEEIKNSKRKIKMLINALEILLCILLVYVLSYII